MSSRGIKTAQKIPKTAGSIKGKKSIHRIGVQKGNDEMLFLKATTFDGKNSVVVVTPKNPTKEEKEKTINFILGELDDHDVYSDYIGKISSSRQAIIRARDVPNFVGKVPDVKVRVEGDFRVGDNFVHDYAGKDRVWKVTYNEGGITLGKIIKSDGTLGKLNIALGGREGTRFHKR